MPFDSESGKAARAKAGPRSDGKLNKLIRDSVDAEAALQVFKKLEDQAKDGEMDAIKVYLSYVIGKPKEFVDITTNGETINRITIVDIDGSDI